MDIFGVGGPELMVLFVLAGILLGPQRIVKLVRETKKLFNQVQALTRNLTQELTREIDTIKSEVDVLKSAINLDDLEVDLEDAPQEDKERELPEAYQRFREDFPDEGKIDDPPDETGGDNGRVQTNQESQPAAAQNETAVHKTESEVDASPSEPAAHKPESEEDATPSEPPSSESAP